MTAGLKPLASRPRSAAFTLVEICVALFLTLALFTMAAGIVKMGMKDNAILHLRDDTGLLVRRVRALAIESGNEQEVRIGTGGLVLDSKDESRPFPRSMDIPAGVKFEIQIWPDDRWIVPEKEVSWVFQPNGICMPLSFRFTQGESFVSFRIHPLTGAVDRESRVIQGKP